MIATSVYCDCVYLIKVFFLSRCNGQVPSPAAHNIPPVSALCLSGPCLCDCTPSATHDTRSPPGPRTQSTESVNLPADRSQMYTTHKKSRLKNAGRWTSKDPHTFRGKLFKVSHRQVIILGGFVQSLEDDIILQHEHDIITLSWAIKSVWVFQCLCV